jgi:hypothetical protein
MNSLLRKTDLPVGNDLAYVTDAIVTTNREYLQPRSVLGFWKKISVSLVILVAIVATSGWLYLIAKSVGAFVRWL